MNSPEPGSTFIVVPLDGMRLWSPRTRPSLVIRTTECCVRLFTDFPFAVALRWAATMRTVVTPGPSTDTACIVSLPPTDIESCTDRPIAPTVPSIDPEIRYRTSRSLGNETARATPGPFGPDE